MAYWSIGFALIASRFMIYQEQICPSESRVEHLQAVDRTEVGAGVVLERIWWSYPTDRVGMLLHVW